MKSRLQAALAELRMACEVTVVQQEQAAAEAAEARQLPKVNMAGAASESSDAQTDEIPVNECRE